MEHKFINTRMHNYTANITQQKRLNNFDSRCNNKIMIMMIMIEIFNPEENNLRMKSINITKSLCNSQ